MVMHSKHLLNYYSVNEKLLSNASYSSRLKQFMAPTVSAWLYSVQKITEINIY